MQDGVRGFHDALEELRDRGYVEGQSITLEPRYSDGLDERLPALARELVSLPVQVLVAAASPEIQAARAATSRIPIVMGNSGDPVAQGFVASLARPGGNVTGVTNLSRQLASTAVCTDTPPSRVHYSGAGKRQMASGVRDSSF